MLELAFRRPAGEGLRVLCLGAHSDDIEIGAGEMVALIGASGSGKSTLMRIIAGLEPADSGDVELTGEDANNLSTQQRGVGFVFQHYALFRHMTIRQNVAFGLQVQKPRPPAREIKARVEELLELVQVRSGQGPCLEAMAVGALVLVEDLAAREGEWPEWVAGARALGIQYAYGIPLQRDGETFGALNLFRTDAGPLSREDLAMARALAGRAARNAARENGR